MKFNIYYVYIISLLTVDAPLIDSQARERIQGFRVGEGSQCRSAQGPNKHIIGIQLNTILIYVGDNGH